MSLLIAILATQEPRKWSEVSLSSLQSGHKGSDRSFMIVRCLLRVTCPVSNPVSRRRSCFLRLSANLVKPGFGLLIYNLVCLHPGFCCQEICCSLRAHFRRFVRGICDAPKVRPTGPSPHLGCVFVEGRQKRRLSRPFASRVGPRGEARRAEPTSTFLVAYDPKRQIACPIVSLQGISKGTSMSHCRRLTSPSTWNINLNTPTRSLKGIMLLFEDPAVGAMGPAFGRNSEFHFNPLITKVQVTVEGIPNQLYAQGMLPYHHWDEIMKQFAREDLKCAELSSTDISTYFRSRYVCIVARFQEQR